jgi:hypothetical protein
LWLNQVEIWFSILEAKSFTAPPSHWLRTHSDAFIEAYNETAEPFVWTNARVHQKRLKALFTER